MTNQVEISVISKNNTKAGFDNSRKDVKSFADDVIKESTAAGIKSGQVLSSGLANGLKTGGPVIGVALTAAVASAAPAAGAAMAAAVIGGVGAGGLIGGIALIKNDARVAAAGEELGDKLLSRFRESAATGVAPLLQQMSNVSSRIDGWGDRLDSVFAASFGSLDNLVDPLLDGADRLVNSFEKISPAIEPVLDAFGKLGGDLLESVADGIESLADNSVAAGSFIESVGASLELAVDVAFKFVNVMAEVYEMTLRARAALGDEGAAEALRQFSTEASTADEVLDAYGNTVVTTTEELEEQAEVVKNAAQAQEDLNRAIFDAASLNISAAEAEIRYRESVKEASEAIDKKSKVTDDEHEALLRMAAASNRATEAMYEQGASGDELREATDRARAEFVRIAIQMGATAKKANELADDYFAIPNKVTTTVGIIDNTSRGIRGIMGRLNDIPRNINITANMRMGQLASGGPANAMGASTAATGGARGGMTLVGEQGPELVRLPWGSTVIPNGQTSSMMKGSAGPQEIKIHLDITGADDELIRRIQQSVRIEGGGDVNFLAGF